MSSYSLGGLLKELRIENGLTQEELCGGLFTQTNYSKIENGTLFPRDLKLQALFQRLGVSAESYVNFFLGENDYEDFAIRRDMHYLIRQNRYSELEEKILGIENKKSFSAGVNLQFLLFAKAWVYRNKHLDYIKAFKLLTQAIQITKPNFCESKVSGYLLSSYEVLVINMMGLVYMSSNQLEKAAELLGLLKENIDKLKTVEEEKAKIYPMLAYNLSKVLGQLERYEESIEICKSAKKLNLKYGYGNTLPKLIFNELYCLNKIGQKEQAILLFFQAYYGLIMMESYSAAEVAKKYAKDELGIEV